MSLEPLLFGQIAEDLLRIETHNTDNAVDFAFLYHGTPPGCSAGAAGEERESRFSLRSMRSLRLNFVFSFVYYYN